MKRRATKCANTPPIECRATECLNVSSVISTPRSKIQCLRYYLHVLKALKNVLIAARPGLVPFSLISSVRCTILSSTFCTGTTLNFSTATFYSEY